MVMTRKGKERMITQRVEQEEKRIRCAPPPQTRHHQQQLPEVLYPTNSAAAAAVPSVFGAQNDHHHQQQQPLHLRMSTVLASIDRASIKMAPQQANLVFARRVGSRHVGSSSMSGGVTKCGNLDEKVPTDKSLLKTDDAISPSANPVSPSWKVESPSHHSKDDYTGSFFTLKVEKNLLQQVSPLHAQSASESWRAKRVPCRRSSSMTTQETPNDEAAVGSKSPGGSDINMSESEGVESKRFSPKVLHDVEVSAVQPSSLAFVTADFQGNFLPTCVSSRALSTLTNSHVSLSKADGASDIVLPKVEVEQRLALKGTDVPSQTTSLNVTEMAAQYLIGDLSDEDEVSSHAKSLVTVNGYKVKPELGPILKEILEKYGDIAANCVKRSKSSRSWLLEKLCEIVERLKEGEIMRLPLVEVESMLELIDDIESDKVEVGWLRQRLDEIKKALHMLRLYPKVKKAKEASLLVIENKEQERAQLLKKLKATEAELEMVKGENKGFCSTISDTRVTLQQFYGKSLLNDLL